ELALAIHHHPPVALLDPIGVLELDRTVGPRLERRLRRADLADTADVERTHRELRTRLADGLRRDDADRLAHVHHVAAREAAAVAQHVDAAPRTAGQDRPDLRAVDAGVLDERALLLVDLVVGRDEHLAGVGIDHVLERDAAEDAIAEA